MFWFRLRDPRDLKACPLLRIPCSRGEKISGPRAQRALEHSIYASRLRTQLILRCSMTSRHVCLLAAAVVCCTFAKSMHAQQSPEERVTEIQAALREAKLDGWLFYDFRHSDPLAYRILKLDEKMFASRRWFYYIPASGEPAKIVQSIEQFKLDSLPGKKLVFRGWQELHARLREVLGPVAKGSKS